MIDASGRLHGPWNVRDERQRNAAVARTYTEDAVYVDPARRGEGTAGLPR